MKKRILRIISSVLLSACLFILLLLLKSASWFLNNFGEVEFSVAVYQLFSPMKGTESGVLERYLNECLYHSVYLTLLFFLFYNIYDALLRVLQVEFDIRFWKKEFCISIGNKFRLISKSIILAGGFSILCFCIWQKAVIIDIPGYIRDITNNSHLYEDEYINPKEVSITFPERKRNLLIIYMESMETTYASVEAGGGKPVNYIPELTELAEENVYFSNDNDLGGAGAAAGTGWTMGGLLASATGVSYKLPVDGNGAGEYENYLPGLISIGEILEDAGYRNYFMCGSDAVFGGRADFYKQHGNYQIKDYNAAKEDGVISEDYQEYWGIEDEKLYQYAKQELTKIAESGEPFNFELLTVDTHASDGYICRLCDDKYPETYANAIACASKQVCQFLDWAKEQDWYENTTIIITGDHLSMKSDFWEDIGDYDRKIYNCFINLPENISAERTVNREFSIIDMFPTALAAIGTDIDGERLGLGTNLFSNEQTIPEKLGLDTFNAELRLYSNYYYNHFIVGNGNDET